MREIWSANKLTFHPSFAQNQAWGWIRPHLDPWLLRTPAYLRGFVERWLNLASGPFSPGCPFLTSQTEFQFDYFAAVAEAVVVAAAEIVVRTLTYSRLTPSTS